MVRLRLTGGRLTLDKFAFVCKAIEEHKVDMVHITTCQSLQLHNLDGGSIPPIVDGAMDAGIFTFNGGGDNPRNITATPLTGIIPSCFDVLPYAECAERFLFDHMDGKRMPRKLKIGFTCTMENGTDATARDLGFIAKDNGKFDVYSGGGLGPNPRLGLLVHRDVEPEDICFHIATMVRMFIENGNYDDRSKARVRYMRDTLGDEGYVETYNRILEETLSRNDIPKVRPVVHVVDKKGDRGVPSSSKARKQMQDGLYYIAYHPLGGDPSPGKLLQLYDTIKDMDQAEVRLSPAETLYVVNLNSTEADRVAEVLSDGARTVFESSVSCVGATVCQQGLRDSHGMLMELIEMARRNGFADGVLPMIRISGCISSCSAHQLGNIGLRGCPSIDGKPAYMVNVNGSHILGRERIGTDIGAVTEEDMPMFFETLGKAVEASGKRFRDWFNDDPSLLSEVCSGYLHNRS